MLLSVLKNIEPLRQLNEDFSSLIDKNLPSNEEIYLLEGILKLIEPLKNLTCDLSGSKYATLSLLYPCIFTLLSTELSQYEAEYNNMLSKHENQMLDIEIEIEQSLINNEFDELDAQKTELALIISYDKALLILAAKLKESIEKRFDFLLNLESEDLFLCLTLLDCRFKSFEFIKDGNLRKLKQKLATNFLYQVFHEMSLNKHNNTSNQTDDKKIVMKSMNLIKKNLKLIPI